MGVAPVMSLSLLHPLTHLLTYSHMRFHTHCITHSGGWGTEDVTTIANNFAFLAVPRIPCVCCLLLETGKASYHPMS